MSHQSTPELLVLHAVRLLGFADSESVARRSGIDADEAQRLLHKAVHNDWVQHLSFADSGGWTLTEAGKVENERQLAAERQQADPANTIARIYDTFLPLNSRLVRAVTDWQLRPEGDDQFAPNNHTDAGWDERVLAELGALGAEIFPLLTRLSAILTRFDGYHPRYQSALQKARDGEPGWVDTTEVDSCHRVWFQLHEDLLATLGIRR